MVNIVDRKQELLIPPLFRLGFRPFFLLGSVYAVIAIILWVVMLHLGQPEQLQVPALWWHVHEMLFGFAFAIVVGFLLTAVQNWTGINGTKHYFLILLSSLWLLVRVLFWVDIPVAWVLSLELVFIALCGYEIGWRVIRAKRWNNLIFIGLFILAFIADIASFRTLAEDAPFSSSDVWMAMLWWFTLLLSVMGARVIPFFTARRFQFEKPQNSKWLDILSNAPLIILFGSSFITTQHNTLVAVLMLISGVAQLVRLWRWQPLKTFSEPLVWSLHLGYLCIPLSLILRAGLGDSFLSHNLLHLFVIGALGGIILSMISRVTLGHTGRNVYAGPNMKWAFVLLFSAAIIRSFALPLFPQFYFAIIDITATVWIAAFGIFIFKFAPMLVQTRADGNPG
ncbi:NnrS family protein [Vibrio sp. RC27]